MSFFNRLRRAATFYRLLYRDARTPFVSKLLPFLAITYFLSPIDLIPDFFPVAGQMDDITVIFMLILTALRAIPRDIRKDNRTKAIEIHQQEIATKTQ